MAVYSYPVVRLPGIGGLPARFAVEGMEPFCTFESLAATRDFLMRKEHRRRLGDTNVMADITTPDWTLGVEFPFDPPIMQRIRHGKDDICTRWLARFDN